VRPHSGGFTLSRHPTTRCWQDLRALCASAGVLAGSEGPFCASAGVLAGSEGPFCASAGVLAGSEGPFCASAGVCHVVQRYFLILKTPAPVQIQKNVDTFGWSCARSLFSTWGWTMKPGNLEGGGQF
jgi:hypothetical protein